MKIILNHLIKKKQLEIINYNNKLQNRLNIDLSDFKKFSEIYSSIEIKIIPTKNKYGKFINIHNEKDRPYFHIFFDNREEEIKRNILNENENISNIKIKIDHQIKSFSGLFQNCYKIE